ncbi:MAG: prenyltransferase [Anaerolineae bacterium]|nr:prenyltransferase [Anaerolineae bacterium]
MIFRTVSALWGMARPLIITSVILVYADGLLIALAQGYALSWEKVTWGGVALLLMTLSIHYTNEYADYETDALTIPTRYSGGSGVLPRGDVPRALALIAAWVTLILSLTVGVVGYAAGMLSFVTLVSLMLGGLGGWMYSLPPLKLAWRGWGELDNAVLGGLLLHIYGFSILSGQVTLQITLICIPFTLFTFNNLLATTWADRAADAQVGKYTLATRYSIPQLRRLYRVVALSAFALLLIFAGSVMPAPVAYAGFLALPVVIWGGRTYTRIHAPYPTSNAMVVILLAQMMAWYSIFATSFVG